MYGTVQRARNCFLYTKKGDRLTDMYQEAGRAILGWGGSSAWTMFKNVLSRGISGSYRTEVHGRVQKALSDLFESKFKVFAYENRESALKASLIAFPEDTIHYRPWGEGKIDWKKQKCIIFNPPLPYASSLCFVCVLEDSLNELKKNSFDSIFIPSPMEAAIAKSIYNLIGELKKRQEKDFFIYDQILCRYWQRKGPYLFPKISQEKYDDFVLHCLKHKIVISPDYNVPSIIPFGADKGVFTSLKNNPFEW